MKILWLYVLFTYLALAAQAIFFKGIKPDFVLILICFYSLKYGQIKGLTYGALSGLLMDSVCGFILGPHIISKSVSGFLMGTVKEQLFQWNVYISTLFVAVFSVVNIILIYLILETFSTVSLVNMPLETSFWEFIYTIIAAIMLYPVLRSGKDTVD